MHTLTATIPDYLRKVLLAAYSGTGCHDAIPKKFLRGFGIRPINDDVRRLAKQQLVNVVKKQCFIKFIWRTNMFCDELRCSERGALRTQLRWVYVISPGRHSRMIMKLSLNVKWGGSLLKDLDSCLGILQLSCKNLDKWCTEIRMEYAVSLQHHIQY